MHPDDEDLFIVAAIKYSNLPTIWEALHAAPEIIVIEIFSGRRLEGVDMATLRIHSGHNVFDGAILAGRVHRLKQQKHAPLVLGVKLILQFREGQNSRGERFFGSGLVFLLGEFKGIAWVDILKSKILPFADAEWLGEFAGSFDDLFCFHTPFKAC
jgi:hypothetical protein